MGRYRWAHHKSLAQNSTGVIFLFAFYFTFTHPSSHEINKNQPTQILPRDSSKETPLLQNLVLSLFCGEHEHTTLRHDANETEASFACRCLDLLLVPWIKIWGAGYRITVKITRKRPPTFDVVYVVCCGLVRVINIVLVGTCWRRQCCWHIHIVAAHRNGIRRLI